MFVCVNVVEQAALERNREWIVAMVRAHMPGFDADRVQIVRDPLAEGFGMVVAIDDEVSDTDSRLMRTIEQVNTVFPDAWDAVADKLPHSVGTLRTQTRHMSDVEYLLRL